MRATNNKASYRFNPSAHGRPWFGMDSDFRLVIMTALRTKQLLHGAATRIETNPLRRKHTSIALEEVKRGLVQFTTKSKEEAPTE